MPQLYGLIGESLAHSYSKSYFTNFFIEHGIDATYDNYEVSKQQLAELLSTTECNYFNVTIPYKTDVLNLVQHADAIAKTVGATNCIKRINGEWHATNTDALALVEVLKSMALPADTKALILGTGGASLAVQYACKQLNIRYALISRYQHTGVLQYSDITDQTLAQYKLVINTTPLGMHPNIAAHPVLPYHAFTTEHYALDLIYNPEQTQFLQQAQQYGAQTSNGLKMLLLQAQLSWSYWQVQ